MFSPKTDQPNITDISSNRTANQSDVVSLTCTADGNPTPNITWTRLYDNKVVTLPLTINGKQDDGYYTCTADNGIGDSASRDVFIAVQSKSQLSFLRYERAFS